MNLDSCIVLWYNLLNPVNCAVQEQNKKWLIIECPSFCGNLRVPPSKAYPLINQQNIMYSRITKFVQGFIVTFPIQGSINCRSNTTSSSPLHPHNKFPCIQDGAPKRAFSWHLNMYIYIYISGWWLGHPSETYESQLGWLFPIYGKIKNGPNHQPDMYRWLNSMVYGRHNELVFMGVINQLRTGGGAPSCSIKQIL